ncbi:MAG TPA: biotin--[acetyl-CoA-carboxylase] ligase [Candidatus Acidoferrales bacterium]|nr:biotin--[acetyl-CoA-carboxylase] ligase [Candidatus Acidoferrales bacterium]
MAESVFDRGRFEAELATRVLGRALVVRARAGSTNDDAWEGLRAGGPSGLAVVADEQTRGRGRDGRTWTHAPGRSLALSVALDAAPLGAHAALAPLAAGVALAASLEPLGVSPRLKWPNDVLLGGRKLAGVLCEARRLPGRGDALVVGAGVNVAQREGDFPPELAASAVSLRLAGVEAAIEDVAAAYLGALEAWLDRLACGEGSALLEAWRARAAHLGARVVVRGAAGALEGVAEDLDADGALVLRRDDGARVRVLAGDVLGAPHARAEVR